MKEDFGILVFGHTRTFILENTLESLRRQNALQYVDLWIDGDQGNHKLREKVTLTQRVASGLDLRARYFHRGQLGFRKLILQAMQVAVQKYRYILLLEDDCFPTRDAVEVFRRELDGVENDESVFSVYGHPFLMGEESGYSTRFQGWGWATTSEKLAPYLERLIDCYSMYEPMYLDFVKKHLTDEVIARLDTTPPRLPTHTLKVFFAWDETLALLTAIDGKRHKLTEKRVIYNCGIGDSSAHFALHNKFLKPPYNMVTPESVWEYF